MGVAGCGSSAAPAADIDAALNDASDAALDVAPLDVIAEAASDVADAVAHDGETAPTGKAAACASTFGTALPGTFGRLDGTILAVIAPGDLSCPMPNSTHIVLQVTMGGAAYRVVVNVKSTSATEPRVDYAAIHKPLLAPAWSDGFHAGAKLDYAADLGLHSTSPEFVLTTPGALAPIVEDQLVIGAKVAVYAQGTDGTSVHDVHWWPTGTNGAIVLDPDGADPTWLVFHFVEQVF